MVKNNKNKKRTKKKMKPSVSIPLEENEEVVTMNLQEYANKLAQELHRVKGIIEQVDVEEIGARIEEVKISIAMYRNLFEILVSEHTKRLNIESTPISNTDVEDDKMTDYVKIPPV